MTNYEHLLEPHELAALGPSTTQTLPIDLVDENPLNPRKELVEVDVLADNIRQFGLLQPVIVRRAGDRFELLGGHRRRAAILLLRDREPFDPRWRAVDAVVRDADNDSAYLMLLSAQLHNRAWKPREEASALERLIIGRTLREVGGLLNRDESWASKRLRVYSDSVLSGYVQAGRLGRSVAEELLTVLDPDTKRDLAERAAAESWSQDHARGQVRALRLDRQLREVARRAHELLELLSVIQIDQLSLESLKELNLLRLRIQRLARGDKPVIPSIEQARQLAGVSDKPSRRERGRPRRRPMPPPA